LDKCQPKVSKKKTYNFFWPGLTYLHVLEGAAEMGGEIFVVLTVLQVDFLSLVLGELELDTELYSKGVGQHVVNASLLPLEQKLPLLLVHLGNKGSGLGR